LISISRSRELGRYGKGIMTIFLWRKPEDEEEHRFISVNVNGFRVVGSRMIHPKEET
jgi:hypothetical protein